MIRSRLKFCTYLYICTLCLIIISIYLNNSAFTAFGVNFHMNYIYIISAALLLFEILMDKYGPIEYFFIGVLILFSLIITYKSRDFTILIDVLLILGAKNIDYKKIIKALFLSILIMTLGLVSGCLLHLIPDLTFIRLSGSTSLIRYSLGFNYPNALSESILILCVSYSILNFNQIRWIRIFVFLLLSLFIFHVTNTKMDVYCILLLIIVSIIQKERPNILKEIPCSLAYLSLPIMSFISLFLGYKYKMLNNFYFHLNKIMENRIEFSNMALTSDKISLFGKRIYENTEGNAGNNGGMFNASFLQYFYIDQSIVRIAVIYGIIILLIAIVVYTYKMYNLHRLGLDFLIWLFLIIVVRSFFDTNFIQIIGNPFIVIIFANLNSLKYSNIFQRYEE